MSPLHDRKTTSAATHAATRRPQTALRGRRLGAVSFGISGHEQQRRTMEETGAAGGNLWVVMAMRGSIRLGTVRGLVVRAHWSVPLIMLFFAYALARQVLPGYAPGQVPVV
ncbi:hypothetical protein AB0D11_46675 [Streptomyces monashensis]|uniref:hypothetical protein n=1 Tax=Streptomyces monashensis TaxID=1678012 RepID=UPI0033D4116E